MKHTEPTLLPGLRSGTKPIQKNVNSPGDNITKNIIQRLGERELPTPKQNEISIVGKNMPSNETHTSTSTNIDQAASHSMSLVEKSANHMFGLLNGLNSNNVNEVNAACNVAKTIQGLMRLQLDAIKLAKELKK